MIMKMTKLTRLICIFSISTILFFTAIAEEDDAVYMSQLLKALSPTPSTWSNETHFCKWNGIVCNQTSSRVQSITLPSSSLTGTLPPDLNNLTELTHIELHNNSLTGSLPSFSALMKLQTILLSNNNFTSIPVNCFSFVAGLRTLNLSTNLNLIPWVFPNDLSESSVLQTLDLRSTNLIGSLRTEMFDWFPNLETIDLSYNNFTGDLPESLGRSSIRYLKLNSQGIWNRFTGTIDVISSMRLLSLAWLHDNLFSGRIPNLSNCTHLFDLQLRLNAFIGLVPPSLMSLSSLKTVSLDENSLQGPIPVFRKGVRVTLEYNGFCVGPCDPLRLTLFLITEAFVYPQDLMANLWTGENPCEDWPLIKCRRGKVISVNLDHMNLTGTISPLFANLTESVNLTLSGNNLTGSIP